MVMHMFKPVPPGSEPVMTSTSLHHHFMCITSSFSPNLVLAVILLKCYLIVGSVDIISALVEPHTTGCWFRAGKEMQRNYISPHTQIQDKGVQ